MDAQKLLRMAAVQMVSHRIMLPAESKPKCNASTKLHQTVSLYRYSVSDTET